MDSEFKDLGILQIKIDGNIITIEQKNTRGTTIVKRNKKRIPPRRGTSLKTSLPIACSTDSTNAPSFNVFRSQPELTQQTSLSST